MDRYDLRTVCAMLWTSLGVGLNVIFLQANAAADSPNGRLVLIPIFAGLAVAATGLIRHVIEHGRTMVFVNRVWAGSMVYLALSAACAVFFQPRFD